jgi:hypothetical protein
MILTLVKVSDGPIKQAASWSQITMQAREFRRTLSGQFGKNKPTSRSKHGRSRRNEDRDRIR